MPAYWIARSRINDPVEYKKYTDRVPDIIAKFGGRVLARGGRYEIMEGPERYTRHVVIEFPTMEQAIACHRSAEYQEAAAFRRRNGVGEVEQVIVEGGDATALRIDRRASGRSHAPAPHSVVHHMRKGSSWPDWYTSH